MVLSDIQHFNNKTKNCKFSDASRNVGLPTKQLRNRSE